LGLLATVVLLRALGTVDSDVAWQLWIGRQLDHGARLYNDIIETNPPLWFWMAVPVDRLSDITHIRSDHLLIVLIGFAAALSIAATDRLTGDIGRRRRTFFLAYGALVLVGMPWLEFGQREHIALIGALPYSALVARRRGGRPVSPVLAAAIGVGAALGFALKHYFLLVPGCLELWLVAGTGRKWRPFRAETLAIIGVGLIYALALSTLGHDYLANVVPLLFLAYGATGAKHFQDLLQPAVISSFLSVAILLSNWRLLRREEASTAVSLIIAASAFSLAYFVQAKGWSYHALPMLGCSAIALAAALGAGLSMQRFAILAAPALLLLPFSIGAGQALRQSEADRDAARAVEGMQAGDAVGFISPDPSFGWHVIPQKGLRFSLRYNGFWMMQAIVTNELRGGSDPRLTKLGERVVQETVRDFECTPPRRIIVRRPSPSQAKAGEFDILAFFLRDREFAALLSHYRPVARTSVQVFDLDVPLPRASGCPAWSPV
jgi:hypothetical protein